MSTAIQWTDVTDNIIVVADGGWWCRMISEGCANCYAAKLNQSAFFGGNKLAYSGRAPDLTLRKDIIDSWSMQRKPKRHFVASMTDVFGDWVPWEWSVEFLRGMWRAPKQTFQVLTKRPEIACEYILRWLKHDGLSEVPRNIQIGTSVENQKWANIRVPQLLKIPAPILFLSVEPLLEDVNLLAVHSTACPKLKGRSALWDIKWVIVGGESGPRARLCETDWVRSIVKQCKAACVPCFVKQLGTHSGVTWSGPNDGQGHQLIIKHPKGGEPSEWPEDLRVREFPNTINQPLPNTDAL